MNTIKSSARITLSRIGEGYEIDIKDDASKRAGVRVKIDADTLAKMLTGVGMLECDAEWRNVDKVGRNRITEPRRVVIPDHIIAFDRNAVANWIRENMEEAGMELNIDVNRKGFVLHDGDKNIVNYHVVRWEDINTKGIEE